MGIDGMLFFKKEIIINGFKFYILNEHNMEIYMDFFKKVPYDCVSFNTYIGKLFSTNDRELFNNKIIFKFVDDFLCLYYIDGNNIYMLSNTIGIGDTNKKISVFKKSIKLMYLINADKQCKIYDCNEEYAQMFNLDKLFITRNNVEEFIYDSKSLTAMDGKKYKNVRRSINKFESLYPNYSIVEYDDSMYKDFDVVYKQWCNYYNTRKEKESYITDEVKIYKWLLYRDKINLRVFILYTDNLPIGFIGISFLCFDTSVVLFERCLKEYVGSSETLWIKAMDNFKHLKFENDGDGGSKHNGKHKTGLYDYKMKFNPYKLINMFDIIINKKGEKIYNSFWRDYAI